MPLYLPRSYSLDVCNTGNVKVVLTEFLLEGKTFVVCVEQMRKYWCSLVRTYFYVYSVQRFISM